MKNSLFISLGIFLSLAASRFIPHPPNFTSLIALSFYVPALLGISYLPALLISFVITDLDSQTTYVSTGTDNLFFAGCENTDNSTVSDEANIYTNQSPAVEVTITSPTQLVTTDSPDTPLDVV